MEITENASEGLRREYTLVVPRADVERRLESRLAEVARTVRVPGFRPGKLPLAVARRRWGRDMHPEVTDEIIRDAVASLLDERKLEPVEVPAVEIVRTGQEDDLECRVVLDVFPELPPIDFGAIALEKPVPILDEAEIDGMVAEIAAGNPRFEEVEGRAAETGDRLALEFAAPEADAGPRTLDVVLGDDGRLPARHSESLRGATAGETRRLEAADQDGDGDSGAVEVRVKSVARPVVPEIDDEFAKAVGCEDVADLRRSVREQAAEAHGDLARQALKRALLDSLAERADFELPQSLVDRDFEQLWQEVESAREDGELDDDDADKSEDELRAEYLGIARRRVALGIVLARTARTAGIEVHEDEVDRRMRQLLAVLPARLRAGGDQAFLSHPERRADFRKIALEEKVTDYFLEKVRTTERPVALEELRREGEES